MPVAASIPDHKIPAREPDERWSGRRRVLMNRHPLLPCRAARSKGYGAQSNEDSLQRGIARSCL